MQAYEFDVQPSVSGDFVVPVKVREILKKRKNARIIVLFDDEGEQWKRVTEEAFLAGYSDQDAAYDEL